MSPQDLILVPQTLVAIYSETSGRIVLICALNHFLSHLTTCPHEEQVKKSNDVILQTVRSLAFTILPPGALPKSCKMSDYPPVYA